jgi:prenyl protein peptidase
MTHLEFIYRASMLCLLYPHVSVATALFLSPIFFGLSHFHHMLDYFIAASSDSYDRLSTSTIFLQHLFQFAYTYVFGVYSAFLFVRTGHIIPSLLAHSLCNAFGFPDLLALFDRSMPMTKRKYFVMLCYLLGAWLFWKNLFFLTQPKFYYRRNSSLLYASWSAAL